MNTHWSKPYTNIISAILSLINARHYYKARLRRVRNEDCQHPIRVKRNDEDFRNYQFMIGHASSRNKIAQRQDLSAFEKYLALNYVTQYGTPEAVQRYYSTGMLSKDNLKGMGTSHLVAASDLIRYLTVIGDPKVKMYIRQYETDGYDDVQHWFDFYRYKHGSPYAVKKFRRKLWVVEILEPKVV